MLMALARKLAPWVSRVIMHDSTTVGGLHTIAIVMALTEASATKWPAKAVSQQTCEGLNLTGERRARDARWSFLTF